MGFTGVNIFFFLLKNIDCGYLLEPYRRGGSKSTNNLCFGQIYENYQRFLSEIFQFLKMKFSIYLNRRVFVMKNDVLCFLILMIALWSTS